MLIIDMQLLIDEHNMIYFLQMSEVSDKMIR